MPPLSHINDLLASNSWFLSKAFAITILNIMHENLPIDQKYGCLWERKKEKNPDQIPSNAEDREPSPGDKRSNNITKHDPDRSHQHTTSAQKTSHRWMSYFWDIDWTNHWRHAHANTWKNNIWAPQLSNRKARDQLNRLSAEHIFCEQNRTWSNMFYSTVTDLPLN